MNNKEFKSSRVQGLNVDPLNPETLKPQRQLQSSRVESFEDLNVYKQVRELTNKIYEITRQGAFSKDYGLVDQIRRASVSVMSNIAEGFERGTNTEFIQFLFIAKGSCGEVRAQLSIAFDQRYIDEDIYKSLVDRCRRISGMLSNLIAYLRGSRFKGSKFKRPPIKSMAEQMKEILQQIRSKQNDK